MAVPATVPQLPADPGHLPAVKPKRSRVSERKRKKARTLKQQLLFLQAKYTETELHEILQRAIDETGRLSMSTRKSDRDSVLAVLERYDAAEISDLLDETGLSRWVLDGILTEFKEKRLIEERTAHDPAGEGGRPRSVFLLIH